MMQSQPSSIQPGYVGAATVASTQQRVVLPFTRWAFYAWMFALPFEVIIPTRLPMSLQGALSIPRMAGVGLALCFLVDPTLLPWRLPSGGWAFIAFFGIFTLSMLRADLTNVLLVVSQLQLLALFLICYNLFATGRATRGALFSYVLACGLAALMILGGVAEDSFAEFKAGGRAYAFGTDPNLYGKILLVGVNVALGLAHVRKEGRFFLWPVLWGIAAFCMIYIARSGSRGTTLAIALGLAVLLLRKGSFSVRVRNLFLLAVTGGAALWVLGRSDVLVQRWNEALDRGNMGAREKVFLEAYGMARDRPLIGWGPAAGQELANREGIKSMVRSSHNMVLTMLIFTGLIGAIPFFWGFWKIFLASWRARTGVEDVLPLMLFVALFVAEMFNGGLPGKLHWTFFAYILAAGALASRDAAQVGTNVVPQGVTMRQGRRSLGR